MVAVKTKALMSNPNLSWGGPGPLEQAVPVRRAAGGGHRSVTVLQADPDPGAPRRPPTTTVTAPNSCLQVKGDGCMLGKREHGPVIVAPRDLHPPTRVLAVWGCHHRACREGQAASPWRAVSALALAPSAPGRGAGSGFFVCEMREVEPSYSISLLPSDLSRPQATGARGGQDLWRGRQDAALGPTGLAAHRLPVLTHTPVHPRPCRDATECEGRWQA